MFGHTSATRPSGRPTYGLVNLFNDPNGPQVSGNQYGDCYMVFKGLRDRVTVTAKDSLGHDNLVSTMTKGIPDMMSEFKKDEGEKFAALARGKVPWVDSKGLFYKEAQFHGPVSFQENVSHVMVDEQYRSQPTKLALLLRFCEKNG